MHELTADVWSANYELFLSFLYYNIIILILIFSAQFVSADTVFAEL